MVERLPSKQDSAGSNPVTRLFLMNPNEQLQAIYDSLPTIECQRKCRAACGPIAMSNLEWARLRDATPFRTLDGEPLNNTEILLVSPSMGRVDGDLACPLLTIDGRCSVYKYRPLICRLYGLVRRMQCPFGCEPSRWLSDKETYGLLEKVRTLEIKPD